MINPKNRVTAFLIDNPKSIATDITLRNDLALYKSLFETDKVVMPKMYYGLTPFRVMCKATSKATEVPVILDRKDKPLIRGSAMIFGCTSKGWQRSLTDYEVSCLTNLCQLFPIEMNGEFVLGYSINGMSWEPYMEPWKEE